MGTSLPKIDLIEEEGEEEEEGEGEMAAEVVERQEEEDPQQVGEGEQEEGEEQEEEEEGEEEEGEEEEEGTSPVAINLEASERSQMGKVVFSWDLRREMTSETPSSASTSQNKAHWAEGLLEERELLLSYNVVVMCDKL